MTEIEAPRAPATNDAELIEGPLPLPQRLLDSPFLLLVVGFVVMFVFYTVWGVIEVMSLTPAPLP